MVPRTGHAGKHSDGCWNAITSALNRAVLVLQRGQTSSIALCTSASVSVRSADRNVRRSERLTLPSGTPLPCSDRTRGRPARAGRGVAHGVADRPRQGVSSTRIEMSRATDGKRGSGYAASACAGNCVERRRGRPRRRRPASRPAGRALGDRRRQLAEHADRRAGDAGESSALATVRAADQPQTAGEPSASGRRSVASSASAMRRPDAFASKKSTSRRRRSSASAAAGAGPGARDGPASRRAAARSGRRSRTAARRAARGGGCGRRVHRDRAAATAAAPRSSPTAGWRSARGFAVAANGAAAPRR